jgi:hypothetical protein
MATLEDIRGNPLTGVDDGAVTAYVEGLTRFNLFIGDPIASAEVATASALGFVMGHVLRAWLLLLSTEAPARRRRGPEPHAGAGMPEICPRRLNAGDDRLTASAC